MKKIAVMFLTAVLLATVLVPFANAEVNNSEHDVTGKYKGGDRTDLYSVDVVWQGLRFDYRAATEEWDSTNHEWVTTTEAAWQIAEGSGNEIAVTNHSSKAVDVNLTAQYTVEGISGTFSKDSFTLPIPQEGENGAVTDTVTFMPSGELPESVTDYAKIGSITVAISSNETEEPPTVNVYTVEFVDYDGTVLKTEEVEEGNAAHAPADPTRDGYIFVKWDKAFDKVLTNLVVNAVYEPISEPTIYVGNVEAKAGETVEVSVYIKNNPGIAGAMITITYDENLELTNSVSGDVLADLTFTKPGRYVSPCNFSWDSESGMSTGDGIILTLTFKVADNAQAGDVFGISCSYRAGDIYDEMLNDVTFDMISGSVTIK